MLHLINQVNRKQAKSAFLLEQTYRLRHDVYVRERGWKAIERTDGREIDQFDNDNAVYLIWENAGRVLGAGRFIPTDKPHLMSELFAHTATFAPVPRRRDVWEITRLFSVRDPSGVIKRNTVIGDLLCGMFEMGLHHKLEAISVVCDTFFLPRFLEQDIKATPLGLPTPYPEGICIACLLPVSVEQLAAARAARGVRDTVLYATAHDIAAREPLQAQFAHAPQ